MLNPILGAPLAIFCRATARLGDDLMVKAAWSEEARVNLLRQARVIEALASLGLPVQKPIVVSDDPALFVFRRLDGAELLWGDGQRLDTSSRGRVARLMAELLRTLHSPEVESAVRASAPDSPRESFWVQASTDGLRNDLLPRLDPALAERLVPRLEWVDRVLAPQAPVVFLHGDVHGSNLLFAPAYERISAVLDLESACFGDPAFDFRYLPGFYYAPGGEQDVALFRDVAKAYGEVDVERALAWHLLTDLGDALWRAEQGASVEGGSIERRVIDALNRLRAAEADTFGWKETASGPL